MIEQLQEYLQNYYYQVKGYVARQDFIILEEGF